MANVCVVDAVYCGTSEIVDKLENDVKTLLGDLTPSGYFKPQPFKKILLSQGYSEEELKKLHYGSLIVNFKRLSDNEIILYTDDRWRPQEPLMQIVAKSYGLSYCFFAEEPSENIFINTDETGKYFSTRYAAKYYLEELEEEIQQSSDDKQREGLLRRLYSKFKREVESKAYKSFADLAKDMADVLPGQCLNFKQMKEQMNELSDWVELVEYSR